MIFHSYVSFWEGKCSWYCISLGLLLSTCVALRFFRPDTFSVLIPGCHAPVHFKGITANQLRTRGEAASRSWGYQPTAQCRFIMFLPSKHVDSRWFGQENHVDTYGYLNLCQMPLMGRSRLGCCLQVCTYLSIHLSIYIYIYIYVRTFTNKKTWTRRYRA